MQSDMFFYPNKINVDSYHLSNQLTQFYQIPKNNYNNLLTSHPQKYNNFSMQSSIQPIPQQFINDLPAIQQFDGENPFSFYEKYKSNDDTQNQQDYAQIDEITDFCTSNKFACFNYTCETNVEFSMHDTSMDFDITIDTIQHPTLWAQNAYNSISTIKKISPILQKVQQSNKLSSINAQVKSSQQKKLLEQSQKPKQINKNFKSQNSITNKEDIKNINKFGNDKQMQDDLQQIMENMQNFKNKQKDKKKQFAKHNKNKTMFSNTFQSVKNVFDQFKNIDRQQSMMMLKMAVEKKKENIKIFKQWYNKRNQFLDLHQSMTELFINQIKKRIKSSMENFDVYLTFFRQKSIQQSKYAQHPIIHTNIALQDNSISKGCYLQFTNILNSMSEQAQQKNKKIQDFVDLINNNIIKQSMQIHLSSSQKQIMKIIDKIHTTRSTLKKCTKYVQSTYEQLENCYNNNLVGTSDCYTIQIKLLRRAARQVAIQKKFGELAIEYYKKSMNEDINRSSVIRQTLVTYSKGLKEIYNIDIEKQQMQQLSKGQQIKLIKQMYEFEQLMDERCLRIFKKKMNIRKNYQVTLPDFQIYLKNFKLQQFNNRMCIIKGYNVKYRGKDHKNQDQCYIVITVDGYLNMFLVDKKQIYMDPLVVMPIRKVQMKNANHDTLDIIQKDQRRSSLINLLWDNRQDTTHNIRFQRKDDTQQFIETIKKFQYLL